MWDTFDDYMGNPYDGFMPWHDDSQDSFCTIVAQQESPQTATRTAPQPPDKDGNGNTRPKVRRRTPYGQGKESKLSAPHPHDNFDWITQSYSYRYLRTWFSGKIPPSGSLFASVRVLATRCGVPHDRQTTRRLPVMYKWLDDHWDVVAEHAKRIFYEVCGHP